MKLILSLVLIALATSKIPDLYTLNKGVFTSDYSVTYNNIVPGDFGFTSEAGDINNDGIPDFMVANPSFDNGKGRVYVIYGKKGSLRQFSSMNEFQSTDGFIITGNKNGQKLGASLNIAGDVNGDGIDDIIIGSPFWNQDNYVTEVGVTYVLFGRRNNDFPSTVDVDRLSSTQGFKIVGETSMHRAGFSVNGAGDVNGDGISDVIVGAFSAGSGGKAYVVYGSRQGLADVKLPPASGKGFTIEGSNQENFGASVSRVGDFNGDGVDDIIIGAHCADSWTGKAYIILGRKGGFPAVILANGGIIVQGSSKYENLGCTVSSAGDFNGDGLQDVIIGAYQANGGRGAAYVILGNRNPSSSYTTNSLDSLKAFAVQSNAFSQLGIFVSGGKDLNGDGLADVIVAAPGLNNEKGAVYVLYGSRKSSFMTMNVDSLQSTQGYMINGVKEGDRFGSFAMPLKDVNKDGENDLLIGAFTANGRKGAAYLFYTAWKCSANCQQCSKPETCDYCASGYGFLNGACVACPSSTHILSGGICTPRCSANCQQCSKPNSCDYCASGFGFLDGECVICPSSTHLLSGGFCIGKCTQNCAYCSRPNSCDTCASGFGFLNGNCVACPSNTHYLSNGICVEKRPQNCAQWSRPDACDICASDFGFFNGECVVCPSTHTLKSGYCVEKCSENCAECSRPGSCDTCASGFGFLNGSCVVCPSNTHYLSIGICLEAPLDPFKQIKDLFGGLFH